MASTTKTSPFQTPLVVPRSNQDRRIATAYNLLNAYQEGLYLVHKTTRAGCTTALVAESINRREQFLVVVPTNKIADKTVIEDSIKYSDVDTCNVIHVPSNHACLKNQELCERFPDLNKLPILPLADRCSECDSFYTCPVTRILHEGKTCDGIVVTYQKIVALMMASGSRPNTTAETVLNTISRTHTAVFDEVHEIQYGKSTSITIYSDEKKEKRFDDGKYLTIVEDFPNIRKVLSTFSMLKDEPTVNSAVLQTYNNALDDKYYMHKLSKTVKNSYCDVGEDSTKFIMAVYSEIVNLTRDRKKYSISMGDVLEIYKMMNMVLSEQVVVHGIRDKGHVKILMVSVDHMFTKVLKSFIMSIQNKNRRTLLTSATICSHDYDQYFLGNEGPRNITFGAGGDPMDTNSKMLILADSKKYGTVGRNSRYKKKEEILQKITTLLDLYGDDDCIIITLSIVEAQELQKDLEKFGHPHPVTYYKAPETIGVSSDARVMIAVGVADKPSNAFDAICETKEESLILREEALHCDTWQAWSRAKDPAGKVPSLVFALGCSVEQCQNIVTWGYDRTVEIVSGERTRTVNVHTDKSVITFPRIVGCGDFEEMVNMANAHKTFKNALHKIKDILTSVHSLPIYYIIGRDGTYFRIVYNVTKFDLLKTVLINRYDTFAEQNHNGTQYFRISGEVSDTLIQNHLDGKITLGSYSTSERGTCKWICFDVDAHRNVTDSEEDVIQKEMKAEDDLKKLTSFLDGVGLKYLVESSGSPHSYHIWLFLEEVAIEKAYYFANAIAKEAGFDGEVNPKQRTWNKDNQYGNLVKMPFAFHRKHKVFSHIHGWEGENMDITVYDISSYKIPKTRTKKKGGKTQVSVKINGVRPCIISALDKQLTGDQGNKMRVAVVREFYNFGMTDPDELVNLFQNQSDFDYEKTAYHVGKIIEVERKVWPQQTLLERCPVFLNCDECDRYDCKGGQ